MRANDEGNFLGTKTFKFKFSGRSVFKLRKEVATQVDEDMFTITLCVHAGFYGRLTPLVVDLPLSDDPLDIVVLPTNSPGENFAVPSVVWHMFVDHTTIILMTVASYAHMFNTLLGNLLLDKYITLCLINW
jgi:hypothetical protein